jgi:hypothetical protein
MVFVYQSLIRICEWIKIKGTYFGGKNVDLMLSCEGELEDGPLSSYYEELCTNGKEKGCMKEE